jgi:hypothetical protein
MFDFKMRSSWLLLSINKIISLLHTNTDMFSCKGMGFRPHGSTPPSPSGKALYLFIINKPAFTRLKKP